MLGGLAHTDQTVNRATIFDPLYVKANALTTGMVDGLCAFRFSIAKSAAKKILISKMKNEVAKYNALVKEMPPLSAREVTDKKGNRVGKFDIKEWWLEAKLELPATFQLLHAVLTHAPNSVPPERVFSLLGNTFDFEQRHTYASYMKCSIQLQFNNRTRFTRPHKPNSDKCKPHPDKKKT